MRNTSILVLFCILTVFSVSAVYADEEAQAEKASLTKTSWGKLSDGTEIHLYTIKNEAGMTIQISNYGALITSLSVPDKGGNAADVVLGFDSLEEYLQDDVPYFGAVVGRYGNRIANGKFNIGDKTYLTTKNEKEITTLHGGKSGFDKKVWIAEELEDEHGLGLKLMYISPDGEEGFPGNLKVVVCYIVPKKENSLTILYGAETDKATPVNLTQHTYFNLKGAGNGTILDHFLTINADRITPVNKNLIPTGDFMDVEGTPFDFRIATKIGDRIDAAHPQIKLGGGYDHNWVLNERDGEKRTAAATLYDPESGRKLEVGTLEPGVQFYAGNFLDGKLCGKGGVAYEKRFGLCLETQHFPDSPNQPDFPSTILQPGEKYQTATIFRFSVEKP